MEAGTHHAEAFFLVSPSVAALVGVQFQHSPGQLVNLLRVAVEESVDMGTRQAAAISFKNLVRKDWAAGEEGSGARTEPPACRQTKSARWSCCCVL